MRTYLVRSEKCAPDFGRFFVVCNIKVSRDTGAIPWMEQRRLAPKGTYVYVGMSAMRLFAP